jgi:diguanylate cyclase (GGDEF)-like protein/PAS domain S-box-containing protein
LGEQEAEQFFAFVMALGALANGVLAVAIARNRAIPGARAMTGALLGICLWMLAAGGEASFGTTPVAIFFTRIKYTAVALVPPFFFLFYLRYIGRLSRRSWLVPLSLAVPLATIALVWTNTQHGLMWAEPAIDPDGHLLVRLAWGPWFWGVHTPYSYALLIVTFIGLGIRLASESSLEQSQMALLLGTTALPFATNFVYLLGYGSDRFSLTPLAFAISGAGFSWGFFRRGLFQAAPVAYRTTFMHLSDPVFVLDASGRLLDANPAGQQLLDSDALPGGTSIFGARLPELGDFGRRLSQLQTLGSGADAEIAVADERRFEVASSPIPDGDGSVRGHVLIARNVSERRRAEAALQENETLLRSIVDHSPNGILRLKPMETADGRIRDFVCTFANPAAARAFDRAPEELVGVRLGEALPGHAAMLLEAFREVCRTGATRDLERYIDMPGLQGWFRFIAAHVGAELMITAVDVTQTKQRELEIAAAAARDPLTGLLNRRGFEDDAGRLAARLFEAERSAAVFFLDLDGFKAVNDRSGHAAGDRLLRDLAAALAAVTRPDSLLARYGGDEFVLLVPDIDEDAARVLGERLVAEASVFCPASVGVAFMPRHGPDLTSLLHAADEAMYEAKSSGMGLREA